MSDVTERIDDLLKNGDFREATTLAISSLGSSDDQVGIYPLYLPQHVISDCHVAQVSWNPRSALFSLS